jgi:hypothetical protein
VGRIVDRGLGQTRGVTLRQVNTQGLEEWKLETPMPDSEEMTCVDYFPNLEAAIPAVDRWGRSFARRLNEQRSADCAPADA